MTADRDARRAVQRVRRLVSQAGQRPAIGVRTALARRTWERLARQSDRWDQVERRRAIEAVLANWAAAGAPDDRQMEPEERDYLAGQFADRRDWAGLWRLARDLPVCDAVAALRLVDPRWRPDAQHERELLRLLTGADLPDGTLIARHRCVVRECAGLAYCGGTLIAMELERGRVSLYRCPDRQAMYLFFSDYRPATAIVASRRGFVTLDSHGVLTFHEAEGSPVATVSPDYRPSPFYYRDKDTPVAVDYETGRTAVIMSNTVAVVDQHPGGAGVTARLPHPVYTKNICLRRGDHVVVATDRQVMQWRLASQPTSGFGDYHYPGDACFYVRGARQLVWVPRQDTICYRDGSGRVGYLDGQSLRPITVRHQLARRTGTVLFGSDGGAYHALAGSGFADVVMAEYMPLWDLADRPQAAWTPRDQSAFTNTGWLPTRSPGVRPFYELLRACVERRFGGDVGIGRNTPRAGDDEIAISLEESGS